VTTLSNADEASLKEDLSDKNEMVNLNARSSRKAELAEKSHEMAILSKRPLHGNTPRIKDWMIVLCFKTIALKC
jgi:hypothetical protein